MIDRATKRLIQIKAMKQVLGHTSKEPKGEVIIARAKKLSRVNLVVLASTP